MTRPGRPTQTAPGVWAQAALDEIEEAGVRALSVQAVARRLSVSKGGAYHHFGDRRALLRAAIALWEARQVAELGERLEAIPDPRERLHALLLYAGVGKRPTVILQLMAAADDPDVGATLERASAARLALLRRIFLGLGATRAGAEHRAVHAYSHYLGLAHLRAQSGVLGSDARVRAHMRHLEEALVAGL